MAVQSNQPERGKPRGRRPLDVKRRFERGLHRKDWLRRKKKAREGNYTDGGRQKRKKKLNERSILTVVPLKSRNKASEKRAQEGPIKESGKSERDTGRSKRTEEEKKKELLADFQPLIYCRISYTLLVGSLKEKLIRARERRVVQW